MEIITNESGSIQCSTAAGLLAWSKAKVSLWTPASSRLAGDEVDWSDPRLSSRAVREYVEALDEEALAEALPNNISLTYPQSRWTTAPGGVSIDRN